MVKDWEDATLVPIRLHAKEVLKEIVDDLLLKDKQNVFKAAGKPRAPLLLA